MPNSVNSNSKKPDPAPVPEKKIKGRMDILKRALKGFGVIFLFAVAFGVVFVLAAGPVGVPLAAGAAAIGVIGGAVVAGMSIYTDIKNNKELRQKQQTEKLTDYHDQIKQKIAATKSFKELDVNFSNIAPIVQPDTDTKAQEAAKQPNHLVASASTQAAGSAKYQPPANRGRHSPK